MLVRSLSLLSRLFSCSRLSSWNTTVWPTLWLGWLNSGLFSGRRLLRHSPKHPRQPKPKCKDGDEHGCNKGSLPVGRPGKGTVPKDPTPQCDISDIRCLLRKSREKKFFNEGRRDAVGGPNTSPGETAAQPPGENITIGCEAGDVKCLLVLQRLKHDYHAARTGTTTANGRPATIPGRGPAAPGSGPARTRPGQRPVPEGAARNGTSRCQGQVGLDGARRRPPGGLPGAGVAGRQTGQNETRRGVGSRPGSRGLWGRPGASGTGCRSGGSDPRGTLPREGAGGTAGSRRGQGQTAPGFGSEGGRSRPGGLPGGGAGQGRARPNRVGTTAGQRQPGVGSGSARLGSGVSRPGLGSARQRAVGASSSGSGSARQRPVGGSGSRARPTGTGRSRPANATAGGSGARPTGGDARPRTTRPDGGASGNGRPTGTDGGRRRPSTGAGGQTGSGGAQRRPGANSDAQRGAGQGRNVTVQGTGRSTGSRKAESVTGVSQGQNTTESVAVGPNKDQQGTGPDNGKRYRNATGPSDVGLKKDQKKKAAKEPAGKCDEDDKACQEKLEEVRQAKRRKKAQKETAQGTAESKSGLPTVPGQVQDATDLAIDATNATSQDHGAAVPDVSVPESPVPIMATQGRGNGQQGLSTTTPSDGGPKKDKKKGSRATKMPADKCDADDEACQEKGKETRQAKKAKKARKRAARGAAEPSSALPTVSKEVQNDTDPAVDGAAGASQDQGAPNPSASVPESPVPLATTQNLQEALPPSSALNGSEQSQDAVVVGADAPVAAVPTVANQPQNEATLLSEAPVESSFTPPLPRPDFVVCEDGDDEECLRQLAQQQRVYDALVRARADGDATPMTPYQQSILFPQATEVTATSPFDPPLSPLPTFEPASLPAPQPVRQPSPLPPPQPAPAFVPRPGAAYRSEPADSFSRQAPTQALSTQGEVLPPVDYPPPVPVYPPAPVPTYPPLPTSAPLPYYPQYPPVAPPDYWGYAQPPIYQDRPAYDQQPVYPEQPMYGQPPAYQDQPMVFDQNPVEDPLAVQPTAVPGQGGA
ncbi:unnamed protein product [Ostreobium quekettii]|uniref:Uncharacterized protein n=1 Tax=Ostreobium quekettii TaxID=121088 RepID=A0A8S1IMZ8_9CHLO|nr:unnamed protein product [Ostreobium quekettii]